jgi:hypothetical protein
MLDEGKIPVKRHGICRDSKDYKSALVIAESETINAESSVDDFVDRYGIIPDMNWRHGPHGWPYMQDGARIHTASSTMAYLTRMATVIDNWPTCPPDLNPIENLWAILKRRVEELQPMTKDHLIDVWEHLEMETVNALVDSMPRRMILVIQKGGNRIQY